jgi:hypothetical protein
MKFLPARMRAMLENQPGLPNNRRASASSAASWRIPAPQLETLIAAEAAAMLAEPSTIAAVLEKAGLPPQRVPAALALAAQFRNDLARDAVRGEALAAIVHRIELSPIRLRIILSAAALSCPTPEMLDLKETMLIRDVPLRIKRRGVEMRLVIAGPSRGAEVGA